MELKKLVQEILVPLMLGFSAQMVVLIIIGFLVWRKF